MKNIESADMRIYGGRDAQGGIWSNFALVSHSPHELTIDFIRLDYATRNPTEGVMVQRVNMSPLLANQLIEALTETLDEYAATMPDGMNIQEDQ